MNPDEDHTNTQFMTKKTITDEYILVLRHRVGVLPSNFLRHKHVSGIGVFRQFWYRMTVNF